MYIIIVNRSKIFQLESLSRRVGKLTYLNESVFITGKLGSDQQAFNKYALGKCF